MKIIGSGLVLFSGVMLGFYKALRYMEIQENLHMMISVMELLIGQIKTERATLKEAVCRISVRQSGEIGRVLQSTARSIQKNDGKELYMIWHEEMETLSLVLPETVRKVWIHMFDQTGFYDRKIQLKQLADANEQIKQEYELMNKKEKEACRLYRSMGLLISLFVIILLW